MLAGMLLAATQAFCPLAFADTYSDMLQLAFPDEPAMESMGPSLDLFNKFGVVKLVRKVKFCVLGPDNELRQKVEHFLDKEMIPQFPDIAQGYIDRDCSGLSVEDNEKIDVLVWASKTPWGDARSSLMPFLSQLPNIDFDKVIDEYERTNQKWMPSSSLLNGAKSVRAVLILRDDIGDQDLDIAILGLLFEVLNPKYMLAGAYPQLAVYSSDGKPVLLGLAKSYLNLLYSDSVHRGDSKEAFQESVWTCINAGRC